MKDDPAASDVIFWLVQAGTASGRQIEPPLLPEIEQGRNSSPLARAQYRLWRLRHARMPKAPRVLYAPEAGIARVASLEQERQVLSVAIHVMTKALSCKSAEDARGLVGEPGIGYVSTHQLLALMLATSRGCLSMAQYERGVGPFARRVYSEMLRDLSQPIDVQVERAAVLVLAGRSDLVPLDYLEGLLKQQAPDGLWHFGVPPRHTSAMAYLALSSLLLSQGPLSETGIKRGALLQ